jgi:tRNA/tmRNA/rRNA uracil-C5-methylase (TrmA/RlmC/RlmD family)
MQPGIRGTVLQPRRVPTAHLPRLPRFGEAGIASGATETLASSHDSMACRTLPLFSGATSGFRLRARLAIRAGPGTKIGMFELGTHRLVHIPHCIVQHPLINRTAAVVRRALVDADVAPYSDGVHRGLARYLQVVVERGSQRAQVVLVANSVTRSRWHIVSLDPRAAR